MQRKNDLVNDLVVVKYRPIILAASWEVRVDQSDYRLNAQIGVLMKSRQKALFLPVVK